MGSSEVSPSADTTHERTNVLVTENDSATVKPTMDDDVETPSTTPVDGVILAHGDEETPSTPSPDESLLDPNKDTPWPQRMWEVFTTFWPLGFIAFGGPQAHVALLRDHLIVKRSWMDEESFIQLFAIGQALPGPTSTQLVVSTALARAGPLGGLLAFFMWNLPSFIVLTICGILIGTYIDPNNPPFYLVGLPPAAISLVFTAFYSFAQKLDTFGSILALVSACVAILINGDQYLAPTSSQYIFPAMMAAGGLITFLDSKRKNPFGKYESPGKGWEAENDRTMKRIGIRLWMGVVIFLVWLAVLIITILLVNVAGIKNAHLKIFEVTYRLGSLIFGGGQVLLPLLQSEVVPEWMTKDRFYQGLALAQSMPGPLFNFAAFLGAVYKGIPGAFLGSLGIFGPGVLLIFAVMPFWARLRHAHWFRVVLHGLNSTAIGLIGAACLILFTSVVSTTADAIVFYFALILSGTFNVAAPYVILAGGVLGAIISKEAASLGQVKYCSK